MAKKPANEGLNISLRIGEVITNEEKEIKMPPEKAKKLTIATRESLEKTGYIEIPVYDNVKEKEEVEK